LARAAPKKMASRAGETEDAVEQGAPDADVDVVAQFDADAAQDEQPEHDHERQIKAAEGRGVEQRKGEVERAAAGQQPDFIAVPDRADAGERGAAVSSVRQRKRCSTPTPRSKPSSTT
jgi:hypothetical protein